jgi:hypothetical protein
MREEMKGFKSLGVQELKKRREEKRREEFTQRARRLEHRVRREEEPKSTGRSACATNPIGD